MKSADRYLKRINSALKLLGIDFQQSVKAVGGFGFFMRDYRLLKDQKGDNNDFTFGKLYPVLNERDSDSGTMSGQYFHQDLYVARKIFGKNPMRHLDIGSRIDGFVAHVACFREIEIIDIRAQKSTVNNIVFRQADLMQLPVDLINSCDSISSLHVIEHFGLGRYGDPIDYYGHIKAIQNITLMLQAGGIFYFSTPIGPQRIEFNAQRVFSVRYLIEIFNENFILQSFSYINDEGDMVENAELTDVGINSNFDCTYGCGIFELIKR